MGNLANIDITIFNWINHGWRSPFLDRFMPMVSDIGRGETLFIIALCMLIFLPRDKKRLAILMIAGLTITYYIMYYLKELIARPRPFSVLEGVVVQMKATGYSFPSGHSIQTWMSVVLLSASFRRLTALFCVFGVLLCISRIYMGHHYPSDVAAGAILGALSGWALIKLSKFLEK